MENKFFNFFNPFLNLLNSGKVFRDSVRNLYMLLAGLNVLIPLYTLYQAIDGDITKAEGKILFIFLMIWAAMAFAGWLGFQLWWNRRDQVTSVSNDGDQYVATPIYAHLTQTAGECIGAWVALVGVVFGLLTELFEEARILAVYTNFTNVGDGIYGAIYSLIYGFFIVLFARVIAELLKAIVTMASNSAK